MTPDHTRTSGVSGSGIDEPYVLGRPASTYLAPKQLIRMMIFRSRLEDRHLLRNRAPASSQGS